MNFDKFKELKPKSTLKPQGADDYFEKLSSLKPRPTYNRVLSVLGTVAAAVTIVVVVSVWALLGRGLKQPDSNIVPGYSVQTGTPELHQREMTDELYHKLLSFYGSNKIYLLSEFDKDNPLTKEQITKLCEEMSSELREDLVLSKKELSDFAYDMFRYDMEFDNDIEYDAFFITYSSLAAVDFVSYSVSDTFDDGTQLAQIEIQAYEHFETVRFVQRGDLQLEYFVSVNIDDTKKAPTLESEFERIATKYCFDSMPYFELGETPDFLSAKYHIAHVLGKDKWVEFKNSNGYSGYGIPIGLFNETAIELYGGITVDKSFVSLEDVNTVRYDTLNLIDLGNNEFIVPLEASGGLEVESYKLINAYGIEYESENAFRITYEVTYKNTSDGPIRYETCYIRSINNFAIYPTKFISHKQID